MTTNQSSNIHRNKRQSLLQKELSGRFECVLCRTGSHEHGLMRAWPRPLHAGLYRMPLLYGFLREIHSLLHRMTAIYRLRCRMHLIYMGPLEQGLAGHREPNTRTSACIEDTRRFVSMHPWATFLDLEMYRDAWQAGAKWGESSFCISKQESPSTPPRWTEPPELPRELTEWLKRHSIPL